MFFKKFYDLQAFDKEAWKKEKQYFAWSKDGENELDVNTSPLQLRIKPTQPNTVAHSPVEQCWYFKQLKIETERKRERWGWRRWWCCRCWCCRCWCCRWSWWWWWWQWWCWWGWWWWWWWQWWTIHSSETDPTSCSHQVASVGFATNRVLAEKNSSPKIPKPFPLRNVFSGEFLILRKIVQC